MTAKSDPSKDDPTSKMDAVIQEAIACTVKAKKNRKTLNGNNFYANKLAELRIDATNIFKGMTTVSPGEVTSLAEMLDAVFLPSTSQRERLEIAREFSYKLKTSKHLKTSYKKKGKEKSVSLFPLSILSKTGRGYLQRIGNEMNGCYSENLYTACLVMMRRLLEVVIIECFENNNLGAKIQDTNGNYFFLEELVNRAIAETAWKLSRNGKKYLPKLRELGNLASHGKFFHAQPEDIEKVELDFRVIIEELLNHAKLI